MRISRARSASLVVLLAMVVAGCAPAASSTQITSQAVETPRERVLTMSIETEPAFIAALSPMSGLAATDFWQRMFNAFLDLYDGDDNPQPYLAESLPKLNTESWVVFPDGTMET